ncbi:hypothetical protein CR513_23303, partial [Mucuna pruriens]
MLRTYGGCEYVSTEFKEFCESVGLIHENTPHHSGTSEKRNRTLLNLVRCMLKSKNLPNFLWGEAVSTATYILNRSPTKRLEGCMNQKVVKYLPAEILSVMRMEARLGMQALKKKSQLHQPSTKIIIFEGSRTVHDSAVSSEGELVHSTLIAKAEPTKFDKAVTEEKWMKAMKEEINSILTQKEKWRSTRPNLWQNFFLQKEGIDYGEVYVLVARIEIVRLVVAIATNTDWSMHQLDVKSTFLNGPLEEEVYVLQPQRFMVKDEEKRCTN